MTWNEFVSHVQLEIDKVTDKDPKVGDINVIYPDKEKASKTLIVSIDDDGQLNICQKT